MTSKTIAEALPLAAKLALTPVEPTTTRGPSRPLQSYWPDIIAILFTVVGVGLSFTKLRFKKWLERFI